MPRELKRLDQLIANCGYASRSEAKGLTKAGRVRVDGNRVTDPGLRVPAGSVAFNVRMDWNMSHPGVSLPSCIPAFRRLV